MLYNLKKAQNAHAYFIATNMWHTTIDYQNLFLAYLYDSTILYYFTCQTITRELNVR